MVLSVLLLLVLAQEKERTGSLQKAFAEVESVTLEVTRGGTEAEDRGSGSCVGFSFWCQIDTQPNQSHADKGGHSQSQPEGRPQLSVDNPCSPYFCGSALPY